MIWLHFDVKLCFNVLFRNLLLYMSEALFHGAEESYLILFSQILSIIIEICSVSKDTKIYRSCIVRTLVSSLALTRVLPWTYWGLQNILQTSSLCFTHPEISGSATVRIMSNTAYAPIMLKFRYITTACIQ